MKDNFSTYKWRREHLTENENVIKDITKITFEDVQNKYILINNEAVFNAWKESFVNAGKFKNEFKITNDKIIPYNPNPSVFSSAKPKNYTGD